MDYVIGDIHGCYLSLMTLLDKINFNERQDRLWFCGDFVNRGPDALAVLRFISSLSQAPRVVLGNHDLHFLAVYYGAKKANADVGLLAPILNARDVDDLASWLVGQSLAIYDKTFNILLTHAGICPAWTIENTLTYAAEVEMALKDPVKRKLYFNRMYGNEPSLWGNSITGAERLRLITNYLTRMRYLDKNTQKLLMQYNTLTDDKAAKPWFDFISPDKLKCDLVFGHWAALKGNVNTVNIHALDTGCCYGGVLTALCLQTRQKIQVPGLNKT